MFGLLNEPTTRDSLNQHDYAVNRGRFYLFWNCVMTSGRPTLVALMAGDAAYQAEKSTNEDLVAQCSARLAQIFGSQSVTQPSEVVVTRWKRDPFAQGSYSFVGATAQPEDYDRMAHPVGNLHFAGEHTAGTHPATVHGAYLSGLRAAKEVFESFVGPIIRPEPLAELEPPASHVWSPAVDSKAEQQARANPRSQQQIADNDYELSVIGAILHRVGARPTKPVKSGGNPYLLYQQDHWYECKASCDELHKSATGNADAKAPKNEVRVALGRMWRDADPESKKPYLERAQVAKERIASEIASYEIRAKTWDEEALKTRLDFIRENPRPISGTPKD